MFKTIYVLKLNNRKYLERLIKYHIHFIKIKYQHNVCFLYVDDDNFKKISKYFKIYDIIIYKVFGFKKYQLLFKKYNVYIISIIIGLIELFILTNITFNIKIMTNNKDIEKLIQNELEKFHLKKYYFVKNYGEKEQIKEHILNNYKNKIEWLEIDRVGCNYYVRVLERIINKNEQDNYQHIVSKRNAIIKEIKASSGQIIRKIDDYVNKGDIIISGNIIKNDEIKGRVKALGTIYGETWYNVKVELPHAYLTTLYTGNSYNRITIDFLSKRFFLFGKKKYENEEIIDNVLLKSKLLPFSINKTKILETKKGVSIYTYQEAEEKGIILAREKLMDSLAPDSKILFQKKLKLYEENSTIIIEVFFKVYEEITDFEKIEVEGE